MVTSAWIHTLVGEHDTAIDLLAEAARVPSVASGVLEQNMLQADPRWDPLRTLPRFQALLER